MRKLLKLVLVAIFAVIGLIVLGSIVGTPASQTPSTPAPASQTSVPAPAQAEQPSAPTPEAKQPAPPTSAEIEHAEQQVGAALQDPFKRRLMECMGVNPWETKPVGWTAPTNEECARVIQHLEPGITPQDLETQVQQLAKARNDSSQP
jgi:pyruvate/2-oxoglutarate dehydrogenase complex dihydrolipoamide acyltransferase (E2) component